MADVLCTLASYVQNMLMEMVKEEVHILLGVTGEINKMGVKLEDVKNLLADADRRNITDRSVQVWVKELRFAVYEASDILDLCQLKAMEQGPSKDMGCLNPLLFCMRDPLHAHDIGRRIKKLNCRLDLIRERSSSFNSINLGSYEDSETNMASPYSGTRETSWGLDESSLVGEKIEDDTRHLVEMLTYEYQTDNRMFVFAIVGVGGIGKTTLAQKIFKNDIIQEKFTKTIWLSVNQDLDAIQILKRAVTVAEGDLHAAGNTKATLEQALIEALKGRKILLILDDVWNYRAWDDVLKTPLANAALAHGSRVLVTTRDDEVAKRMFAVEPYHRINKLETEDAWLLLKKQVVRNGTNDEQIVDTLKDIGIGIIAKCDGLPLAVKVMGGLLREKNTRRSDWKNVLNNSVWSSSQMPEELNYAVLLSYQYLPPNLKPCFLHFGLLPTGREFWDDHIISMWISEGFIHENSHNLEKIGREYYEKLISRNLIEPNLYSIDHGVCRMHDVVRSFAHYMARHEALITNKSEGGLANKSNSKSIIRLSLEIEESESSEVEWSSLQAHTSLRTLILVGQIKINPGDSLLSFSCLRILHLEGGNFDVLSGSLVQLKHLRYLLIRGTGTCRLPENIAQMKLLQHIDFAGCIHLERLPNGIVKLQHLRLLGLNSTGISKIPKGFGGLTNLRKLYGFPVHMEGDWCSLEEIGPLNQLMRLKIYGLENVSSPSFAVKARLGEKECLTYLHINCTSKDGDDHRLVTEDEQQQIKKVFDELLPPPHLENLRILGYFSQRLPRWMTLTGAVPLGSLRNLMLDDLVCCTELPNGLCQLPSLEFLKIERAPAIRRVGREFTCCSRSLVAAIFSSLRQLRFIGMVEWEEWDWEKEFEVVAMPVLELLHIQKCKLRHIPSGLAFHGRALKILRLCDVKNLGSLENLSSVVQLDVIGNIDLERIINLPKLQKLVIVKCPKIRVLEGMPALESLVLEDYDMDTIPRYLQDVKPRRMMLYCCLRLLTYMAAGKLSHEWHRFNHIQQVKAYAINGSRKWHVLYTRGPFCLETNINLSAIAKAQHALRCPNCSKCPIEDQRLAEGHASAEKCRPLCVRFSCNAHRHLFRWLRHACLHCQEIVGNAPLSEQWIDAPSFGAGWHCQTKYGSLKQQEATLH